MSKYICVKCGHGDQLYAISYGYMIGPLDEDGELLHYDTAEDNDLQEDTIACTEHGDTIEIHKNIDGVWHEWIRCETCGGTGRIRSWRYAGSHETCPYRDGCGGSTGEWRPIEVLGS